MSDDKLSISKKKLTIIAIVIIVIVAVVGAFMYLNNAQLSTTGSATALNGKTEFNVYANEPQSVESQVQLMDNDPEFYDNNETRDWLSNLTNYVMLGTSSSYLIMERSEASKLPVNTTAESGVYPYNTITCDVVETHSLGTGLKDCILVKNVEFVKSGVEKV